MSLYALIFPFLPLACALLPTASSEAAGSAAPVVPAGTPLQSGVSTALTVSGDLAACGITEPAPTELELTEGPPNGPFATYTLRPDARAWEGWDPRLAMDLMGMPAGSKLAAIATAELGRAPAATNAYGIVGRYDEVGDACDTRLYAMLVEPTTDGWQVTEVARRATIPPVPFDDDDPTSNKVCGLDREAFAKVAPCGTRVTTVKQVTPRKAGGALTGGALLAASGLARGMARWDATEAQLVERLGPPTRVADDHYTWAVRDGATCVWFDVQKGWPGPILGDGKADSADFVGTVTEPYAAVDGAPYYTECMALTGG